MLTEVIDNEDMITETDWDFGYEAEIKPKEEVVAKDIYDSKECSVRKHVLQTNLTAPIFIPAYRKSMHEKELIKEHVQEMLDTKIIEPSSSPWSSPVLIIPKSDVRKRFCVDTIRNYTASSNTEWHKGSPFVSLAYRSRVHSSTGYTPFELMFGRKMTTFDDWRQTEEGDEESSLVERAKEIRDLIEKDHVLVKENIDKSQESYSRIEVKRLPIETKVYVKAKGIGEKLRPKYEGPFTVVEHAGGTLL